jgi:hypothetical protein
MRTVPRLICSMVLVVLALVILPGQTPRTLRVWVFSDAHVASDQRNGRESLAEALRQSESASGFEWNIALDLADMSGAYLHGNEYAPQGRYAKVERVIKLSKSFTAPSGRL